MVSGFRQIAPLELPLGQDALFEQACNDAAVGLCLVDPAGTFLRVNPALCQFLERRESEIVGTNFACLTHPDDLEESRRAHRTLTEGTQDSVHLEKRYLLPGGGFVWADLTISTVRHPATGTPRFFISQVRDITARKEAERQLRESREAFRLLAETSTDLIARLAVDGTYLYVSPACQTLLGYAQEEMVGHSTYDFIHAEDAEELRRLHRQLLDTGEPSTSTYRISRANAGWAWFETSARLVHLGEEKPHPEIHASSRDVTGRKRAEERIRELARRLEEANRFLKEANLSLKEIAATDPLTGLGNRRDFERRLNLELRRASRSGTPVSLLYLDLDRFKAYNDRFGHPAGDEVLIKLGALLADSVRTSDSVARLGGEEFVVLLPQTGVEGAVTLAEKLRLTVAQHLAARRPITVSVGAATLELPTDGSPDLDAIAGSLVDAADTALYTAKREGRNRVCQTTVVLD